jgi:hypothetical protein
VVIPVKLTKIAVSRAKPTEKTQKLFNGGGLVLEVTPKGAQRWRFKYRFGAKKNGSSQESVQDYHVN